ncbi:MAG: hypothetical protein M1324_01030 [Patescibacteria group bacterium]|nr:hypothetical protein [Patescibacteria group bacterium]
MEATKETVGSVSEEAASMAGVNSGKIVLPRKLAEAIRVVETAQTGAIVVIPRELSGVTNAMKVLQLMKAGLSATIEGGKLFLECVERSVWDGTTRLFYEIREREGGTPFKFSISPYEAARGLVEG